MEPLGFTLFPFLCMLGAFLIFFVISLSLSLRIVPEEKRLALYRLGRYLGDKGPGLVIIIPFIDRGILKDAVPGLHPHASPQPARVLEAMNGRALSRVFRDGGQVLLENGVKFDAISDAPIAEGRPVRVRRVIVEVESAE